MQTHLPKSLHTVTVLVRVAKLVKLSMHTNEEAVEQALFALGLHDLPDTYNLKQAAVKQLNKQG